MSANDYVNVAYDRTLKDILDYIYKKEIKKTWLATAYGCSRQTLNDYLKGNIDVPYRFILFMRHLMKSNPCQ